MRKIYREILQELWSHTTKGILVTARMYNPKLIKRLRTLKLVALVPNELCPDVPGIVITFAGFLKSGVMK